MEVRGKKAGKAAKGAQKPKKAPKAKKPRQARLPGTEDKIHSGGGQDEPDAPDSDEEGQY